MYNSMSALSSASTSSITQTSASTEKEAKKVLRVIQKSEEKTPVLAEGEAEKKLNTILNQIQKNDPALKNCTLTSFGRFYEPTEAFDAFRGLEFGVLCLAVLPNGRLASGSSDKTIKLWDLTSNSCLSTLQGHTSWVRALAALPNGLLASGSEDNTIKLWDLASHSCLSTLKGHTLFVETLAVLPNGLLASGSHDKTIKLWDLASNSRLSTLQGHTDSVWALAVLPNGQLASGSGDSTIKIWDLTSHSCLATLQGHTYSVYALAVLPNGLLASGSHDKTIKLWDLTSNSCLSTLQGHTYPVYALAVLPNGQLASGSGDKTIKLWDLTSHSCLSTLQGHTYSVWALAVLPNGQLASGSGYPDNTIKLGDPKPTSLSAKHLLPILKALKTNTSVTDLDLSKNIQINDEIIDSLIALFTQKAFSDPKPNTTLKTIDLRKTGVTQTGIAKLQKAIQTQSLLVNILSNGHEEEKLQKQQQVQEKQKMEQKLAGKKRKKDQEEKERQVKKKLEKETQEKIQQALKEKEQEHQAELKKKEAEIKRLQEALQKEQKESKETSYVIAYKELKLEEKELGKGSFGTVYKGSYHCGDVAIKKLLVDRMTAASETEFKKEVSIMARLKHPNIVALYGYTVSPYCMVMELMHTTLYDVLQNGQDFPWAKRRVIAMDIAAGLLQLHECHILHRDLKSLNVLLSSTMRAKLADFGLSKVKTETKTKTKGKAGEGAMGTLPWMAPELFDIEPTYSKASDIYAYGIVLWEIATRKMPYEGANDVVIMRSVSNGQRVKIPSNCPPNFASLIPYCWHQDATKRPAAKEIGAYWQSEEKEFKPKPH